LLRQIILYIRHRLKAGHRKGSGVHPPFAFKFISEVIFGEKIPGLQGIEDLRISLSGNKELLEVSDHGAGSKLAAGEKRSVRKLVKHTAVSRKKGELLARISGFLDFPVILELGTGTGISSLYLAMGSPNSNVFSCEGSSAIGELAKDNVKGLGTKNISISVDTFMDWLPGMLNQKEGELLVFLDGDHRGDRLLHYCEQIMTSERQKRIIVLDDIHWSQDMFQAWRTLTERKEISLSLELFNLGIVFLGFEIQKGHYIIRF